MSAGPSSPPHGWSTHSYCSAVSGWIDGGTTVCAPVVRSSTETVVRAGSSASGILNLRVPGSVPSVAMYQ